MSACPYVREIEEVMSNFDHEINTEIAAALKIEKCFARYAGWNFNGRVWWDRDRSIWMCEVWTYGHAREIVEAETLEIVMSEVSNRYGYD